jgi:hypothetical protein
MVCIIETWINGNNNVELSGYDKQMSKRLNPGPSDIASINKLEGRLLGIQKNARVDALERLRCKLSAHSIRVMVGTHIRVVTNVAGVDRY